MKKRLIEALKQEGADLVRFGNADRFADSAVKRLFPEVKTVVGIAFRQLRGSRRGIEEGSTYYQYTTTAVETIEETLIPKALLRGCAVLEDAGAEALPQRRNQTVMQTEGSTNFEVDYLAIYRGKMPENQLDFEQCAVDCGIGERGLSGSILTDEFGPFIRCAFLLTDAVIEPDPVVEPHLCDRCGECVKGCPGRALSAEGVRDPWQCAAYYNGANRSRNPFMPPDAFANDPERLAIIAGEARLTPERARAVLDSLIYYLPVKHAYQSSICGRACDTACYIHLEQRGVLTRRFHQPFRIRPEWKLSLEDL